MMGLKMVHAGCNPEELANEFEPTVHTIWNMVAPVDASGGKPRDLLTSSEREELTELARELR